jgi:hypothetical protein
MNYLISVLVLPLLQMLLHDLWIECLKAVWLHLEAIIEFLDILNIVVNCLRPLLLDSHGTIAQTKITEAAYRLLLIQTKGRCHRLILVQCRRSTAK